MRVKKEFEGLKFLEMENTQSCAERFGVCSERTGYLFASGVIPRLGTYPGTESPVPLRIDVQHGAANITQVARDILALTKLNYNECKIGDSEPVTIGFSSAVGEILVSNPTCDSEVRSLSFTSKPDSRHIASSCSSTASPVERTPIPLWTEEQQPQCAIAPTCPCISYDGRDRVRRESGMLDI